jgi:uracil permease
MSEITPTRRIIQVDEKVPFGPGVLLSFQHLFAMFSASVLVPFLFNQAAGEQVLNPALALLMNGIGTLIFFFVCRHRAPAFLGSSFAYISPACAIIASAARNGWTWCCPPPPWAPS